MSSAGTETNLANPRGGLGRRMVSAFQHMKRDRQLLILFIPCLLFYIIFRYGPLYGLIIAFKDYSVFTGILESDWVGLKHFEIFQQSGFLAVVQEYASRRIQSDFRVSFSHHSGDSLKRGQSEMVQKSVQTLSYLPSFLSVVIISGMIIDFLSPNQGIINQLIAALGFEKTYFLIEPSWFRTIYVSSDIWATVGYEAIIYMVAIAGISPSLYEAAKVDGAKRRHMIFRITIPAILPTIIIMFVLKTGSMLRIGYEKVLRFIIR